MHNIKRNG